jgi:6-phosphogluconolactonase
MSARPGRRPSPGGPRRLRILGLICLLAVLLAPAPAAQALADGYLVYVGTYTGQGSEGIYAYRFDPATGEAVPLGLAAKTDRPSFLAADPKGRFLYAANELETFGGQPSGAVSVFAIDRTTGRLDLLQQVSSLGRDPAHLSLDKTGRHLLVANYTGGSVAVFPIGDDGRLGLRSDFVQHAGSSVNPARQAGPHAHAVQVTIDDRFVLVADLGLDKLLIYRFDAQKGSLTPADPGYVKLNPGAGPRHLALAPSGKYVYVVNELSSTVAAFAYDPGPGALVGKQTVPTLPKSFAGKNTAAEIAVDAKGRYLYASNRGDDSVAVFVIDPEDGDLALLERVPSGGRTPRHFAIDPTGAWLFAANQDSNDIHIFKIDPATGRLAASSRALRIVSPVCVLIVSVE